MNLSPKEQAKQELYRDARFTNQYDNIWKTVGKCAFCEPRNKYVFYEENGIFMTIALYAYIDGHFMIIPRRHVRSVKELTPLEWETVRKCMYMAKKLIRKVHKTSGMQTVLKEGVTAQSTVGDHIHFHCIPFDSPDLSVWNYRRLKHTPLENAQLYKAEAKTLATLATKFDQKYAESPQTPADKKELYCQAFSQVLANKKASKAKKTAKVGVAIIAGGKIISANNANLADGEIEQEVNGAWVSPPTVSHAEERCVAQAARDGVQLQGATMIVSLSPCMTCSRLIVNSGIKELHYIDDWWDQNALTFLAKHNIKVIKLPHKKAGR